MRDKIYYIADTFGAYYGFNQFNKLVPVNGKEQATKLTFLKANNVLQNMIKPTNRYQYILIEAGNDEEEQEVVSNIEKKEWLDTRFDGLNTDWQSHLEEILSFVSQLQQYKCNLSYMYSQVEKEICDIMHYIEFNNLDAANGYKIYKMLRECRLRRRKIKDEDVRVTVAIQALGNIELQDKLKESMCQIKALDNRNYRPRVLNELFENVS